MIKRANEDHEKLILQIKEQKEQQIFSKEPCYYVYNNCVFDSLDKLKQHIKYDEIDKFFLKNIPYYRCCLNGESIQKYFS
jgi:hypothetical protein